MKITTNTLRKLVGLTAGVGLALTLTACSSSDNSASETTSAAATASETASATETASASPTESTTAAASATESESATMGESASPTSSVAEANAVFCASTAALKEQVDNLESLTSEGSTTIDQLTAQRETVKMAGQQVVDDAKSLKKAVQAEVAAATKAFDTAMDAIPGDAPVAQAKIAFKAAAAAYNKTIDAINKQVGC